MAVDGKTLRGEARTATWFAFARGPKFELLATNPMGEALMATPAVSGGMLIIRTQTHVYAVAERAPRGRAE